MHPLNSLILELRKFRDERGWRKYHTLKNLAISISIEAAELLEIFQWRDDEEEIIKREKNRLEDEIADIFIYLLFFCDTAKIDLLEVSKKKLEVIKKKYPVGYHP